jgi:hypothetical protein
VGYHTVIAASEAELDDPEAGFSRLRRAHPNRRPSGPPGDHGGACSNACNTRLTSRPRCGCIFDTHPPLLARDEFAQRYYAGDPTDSANRHAPEMIADIRGVESLADFLASIERMRAGEQQASITVRLRHGRLPAGRTRSGPDLAAPRALRANSPANWRCRTWHWPTTKCARRATARLHRATGLADQLQPFLSNISRDVAWLDGVQDYRFAPRSIRPRQAIWTRRSACSAKASGAGADEQAT